MRTRRHPLRVAAGLAWLASVGWAQERAGEAEIGFQQYFLTNGSRRVANALGLTLGFRQFVPRVGIFSLSLAPAVSQGRFRTGDNFVELKRFPWLGHYWTFRGGDFRLPGRPLDVSFSNLYCPEIAGRGAWIEATHGGRTFGFLFGAETLQAGVRVPLRLSTPQTMAGAYFRQRSGERLVLGARLLLLSNDLEKLRKAEYLAVSGDPFKSARTATLSALYTLAGPLKWFGEATLSEASREESGSGGRGGPVSATTGPLLETGRFTLRANYVYQTDSYLPLLGYYLGDRRGPYVEVKVRPFSRLELYGSASDYTNNVARDPRRATFRGRAVSAGASLRLPARFSLSGQWSAIKLATRKSDADPSESTTSEQIQMTLARPIRRHSLRLAVREFRQRSRVAPQRQRTAEVADAFQYRWFSLGGEVRAQQLTAEQSKMSVFVRGNGQITLRRFSAYANVETGNDLANRTLFATSTMSTTVLGAAVRLGRDWNFSVEAFRSKLITELNRQNVFILQGQGVSVPTVLSALNQWSLFFRMSKRFRWGKAMPPNTTRLDDYAIGQNPLKGSVEGFVAAGTAPESRGVEGIPVTLDGSLTVLTDANGRFRFENVAEGARKVGLAMSELPADYNPGTNVEKTVLVRPGKPSRADLDVIVVGYAVQGIVLGAEGASLGVIVLKLLPTERYTTPDGGGRFSFYNVRGGNYEIALAEETLPQYAVLKTPGKVPVTVEGTRDTPQVRFEFDVRVPPKPVRKVLVAAARAVEIPQRAEAAKAPEPARQDPPNPPPPAEAPLRPAPTPHPETRPSNTTASQPNARRRELTHRRPEQMGASGMQLYERGRELTQSGNFDGAVAVLTEAIAAKRDFSLAYNARGYALLRLFKYSESMADFSEAIRLNPVYRNAYRNRGAAKNALKDIPGAQADADKAYALR